jgi:hypothetical protein
MFAYIPHGRNCERLSEHKNKTHFLNPRLSLSNVEWHFHRVHSGRGEKHFSVALKDE